MILALFASRYSLASSVKSFHADMWEPCGARSLQGRHFPRTGVLAGVHTGPLLPYHSVSSEAAQWI